MDSWERVRRALRAGLPPGYSAHPAVSNANEAWMGEEWLVTQRASGTEVSRAWPDMPREARASAARQLAEILRALHSVNDPALPSDGDAG